jgi:periplasmic divalent cation tolerance protein
MTSRTETLVVLATAPDEATAQALARQALEARLVACANLLPGATSMYWWEGRIETAPEWVLVLKTTRAQWPALQQRWTQWHPYDVPELLALDVTDGLAPYLRWVAAEARGAA